MLDLVIVGGGPAGINCGIAASKAKLNFKIIEKGLLVNSIFNFPTNMTFFSTSKLLEIGEIPFISHLEKPTRKEALEYYRRIWDHYKLPIHFQESVLKMISAQNAYQLSTDKNEYKTKAVIVATGFYGLPNLLNVPGENLPKVKHYYDEAHNYIGQKTLIVGAANSACDAALETWQKGAEVTMAIRKAELNPRVKYWILPNIKNRIEEGSIKAHFETLVKEIKEKSVVLEKNGESFEIENDYVLAMTGYHPDYTLLKNLGIKIDKDEYSTPHHNLETLETNLKNVFVTGVLNGGYKTNRYFIENTREQGNLIIEQILRRK